MAFLAQVSFDPTLDPFLARLAELGRYLAGRGFLLVLAVTVALWLAARVAVRLREFDVAVTARIWFRYGQAATAACGLAYLLLGGGPGAHAVRAVTWLLFGAVALGAAGMAIVSGLMWAGAGGDWYARQAGRQRFVVSAAAVVSAVGAWAFIGALR